MNPNKDDMEITPEPKPKSDSHEDEPPPPDNGAFYCSLCNWLMTMYHRFDSPFVTFFIV